MKIPDGHFLPLNMLHVLNDGFQASLVLLLPFIASAQHLTLTQVGTLGTILNVAGIVLALPAGYIAAKIGGLKTLLIALGIYGVGFLGAGILGHYYLLLAMFLLAGIGFGVFHPIAFALIAKWSPKERRGRVIGNFTAIGDVGRIGISAAISFIVVAIGWQKTAVLYAAVALCVGVGMFVSLAKRDAVSAPEHKPAQLSLWQILKNRRLVFAMLAGACDSFASASLYVFLPFLLIRRGIDPALLGSFTAAFFVGNLFGKTLLGQFVDLFGNVRVFIMSEVLMATFILLLANATALWVIVACSLILGIFTKGTVPVQQTMVSEAVEHHGNFEKTFGMGALVTGVASTLAPLVLGAVSDSVGIVPAFNVMALAALAAVAPAIGYRLAKPAA